MLYTVQAVPGDRLCTECDQRVEKTFSAPGACDFRYLPVTLLFVTLLVVLLTSVFCCRHVVKVARGAALWCCRVLSVAACQDAGGGQEPMEEVKQS